MQVKSQIISLAKLHKNTGQIPDVPKNPRFIKDYRYQKLKQSIEDDPEMLELRELIVYPLNGNFIVIAGNQRLAVLQELKFKDTLCKILPAETPVDKIKRYIIKDNIPFGEPDWDLLANEWDETELISWGMELPFIDNDKADEINAMDEWKGMPEYIPGEKPVQINIYFRTPEDRDKFSKLTELKFSKKFETNSQTWAAWWPYKERRDMNSIKFVEKE